MLDRFFSIFTYLRSLRLFSSRVFRAIFFFITSFIIFIVIAFGGPAMTGYLIVWLNPNNLGGVSGQCVLLCSFALLSVGIAYFKSSVYYGRFSWQEKLGFNVGVIGGPFLMGGIKLPVLTILGKSISIINGKVQNIVFECKFFIIYKEVTPAVAQDLFAAISQQGLDKYKDLPAEQFKQLHEFLNANRDSWSNECLRIGNTYDSSAYNQFLDIMWKNWVDLLDVQQKLLAELAKQSSVVVTNTVTQVNNSGVLHWIGENKIISGLVGVVAVVLLSLFVYKSWQYFFPGRGLGPAGDGNQPDVNAGLEVPSSSSGVDVPPVTLPRIHFFNLNNPVNRFFPDYTRRFRAAESNLHNLRVVQETRNLSIEKSVASVRAKTTNIDERLTKLEAWVNEH